jgi:hypothetical protein
MKKKELCRLALLGMIAGSVAAGQPGLEATFDENVIDMEHVIAKPKCKAHGGCGGLTASRSRNNEDVQNEESLDEDEDESDESHHDDSDDRHDDGHIV